MLQRDGVFFSYFFLFTMKDEFEFTFMNNILQRVCGDYSIPLQMK
jgi:hypothetical protein